MNIQEQQSAYARTLADIRGDEDLSPEGKKRKLATAWAAHKKAMNEARQQAVAEVAEERQRLERKAFGAPPDVSPADYRDALGRADALETSDAANAALRRAQRTGDVTMARALAVVAGERGWRSVLATYAGQDVASGDALDQLAALASRDDGTARFHRSVATSASQPEELRGLNPGELGRLTGDAPKSNDWVRSG